MRHSKQMGVLQILSNTSFENCLAGSEWRINILSILMLMMGKAYIVFFLLVKALMTPNLHKNELREKHSPSEYQLHRIGGRERA